MTELRLDVLLTVLAVLSLLAGFAWRWDKNRNHGRYWLLLLLGIGYLEMQLRIKFRKLIRRGR